MDAQNIATPSKRVNGTLIAGAVAVILAAFVLIFVVSVSSSISATSVAGDMGTATTASQDVSAATNGKGMQKVVAAGSALSAQPGGEVIADEANPLGAYPTSNPLEGITWLLLAGIAGATVFFLLTTRRMNKDISNMRNSIR